MTKYNCYFFSSQQKYFTETNLKIVSIILAVFASAQNIFRDHFTHLQHQLRVLAAMLSPLLSIMYKRSGYKPVFHCLCIIEHTTRIQGHWTVYCFHILILTAFILLCVVAKQPATHNHPSQVTARSFYHASTKTPLGSQTPTFHVSLFYSVYNHQLRIPGQSNNRCLHVFRYNSVFHCQLGRSYQALHQRPSHSPMFSFHTWAVDGLCFIWT